MDWQQNDMVPNTCIIECLKKWGARGVIGIVVGNQHGDTSSNPGRDWLHFT